MYHLIWTAHYEFAAERALHGGNDEFVESSCSRMRYQPWMPKAGVNGEKKKRIIFANWGDGQEYSSQQSLPNTLIALVSNRDFCYLKEEEL